MNHTEIKLKPGNYWDIAEYESWFSDMARRGLHLEKVGIYFARFAKGDAKQMRYRITAGPSPAERQFYVKNGWDYVTSFGPFLRGHLRRLEVFTSPEDCNAPELTDPAGQAYSLKPVQSKIIESSILYGIMSFLYIMLMVFIINVDGKPYLSLLDPGIDMLIICFALFIISTFIIYKAAYSIYHLRKNLSDGIPMNHVAPWKKKRNLYAAIYGVMICAMLFIIYFIITAALTISNTQTLPEETNQLPIARLSEIEQNSNLERKSEYVNNTTWDFHNHYRFQRSLLAPVQYESEENGLVPNIKYKDESGIYSPSVSSTIYQTAVPFMNKKVLSDLVNKYVNQYENQKLMEVKDSDFDKLYVLIEDYGCEVFAVKGRGIMAVRYFGSAGADTVIHIVSQALSRIA